MLHSEIESLTMKVEELCNINLYGENLATNGGISPHEVHDPNIVKTKGNPSKIGSYIQKNIWCSQCKKVGYTIRKCPQSRIPHNINDSNMVCKIFNGLLVNIKIYL